METSRDHTVRHGRTVTIDRAVSHSSDENEEHMRLTIVPGIDGSGPAHWQTLWEAQDATARRIAPSSWHEPELNDWLHALDVAVAAQGDGTILVAHSLGTLAAAEWLVRNPGKVAGALLVAPPDRCGPEFPMAAPSFRALQPTPLGVPSLLVASDDDHYCEIGAAQRLALAWGAEFTNVGSFGHLNAASNIGEWSAGRMLLDTLTRRIQSVGVQMQPTRE